MGLFSRKRKHADTEDLPPEAAAIVEQLRDVFPDAAITVDEPIELSVEDVVRGAVGDDRISQLERLAKLREQGALTESEFQAEKARILGEG